MGNRVVVAGEVWLSSLDRRRFPAMAATGVIQTGAGLAGEDGAAEADGGGCGVGGPPSGGR